MNPPAPTEVSVIVVTRNTCALVRDAIESVFRRQGSLAVEIVVVDNGSTDETASVLLREFPQIQLLRSETNLGFARACNLASKAARSEFLLLLNSDARLQPEALSCAVGWMRAHPECGVVGGQLLNPDGRRQNSIAGFPSLASELLNKSLLRRLWPRRFPGKELVFHGPVEVESVIGAFFLTRKSLWDRLEGLDERFFFFFEETDFCLRARQAGAKVMHLPQVEVWHGQGQSARQLPSAARIEYWRSRYLYFKKHRSPGVRLVLFGGLAVRLLVDASVNGLATLATLGRAQHWRKQFAVYRALLAWHCRGCPKDRGLPR